jgi:hypothetical protein
MGQDTELRRLRGFGDTTIAFALREGASELIDGTPLPEVALSFEGASGAWRVRHLECVEGLSWLYECVVDLATDDLSENPDVLLGRPAHASVARGEALRRIHGVVRRVEHRGTTATHRLARVYLVPALWTLSQASDVGYRAVRSQRWGPAAAAAAS